jgi:basic membrane lipoprotein Med (substrate-binding protein (PBP1-ABC) superfamily)
MTKQEYERLSLNQQYKFRLYYGEEKIGILTNSLKDVQVYYFISSSNIKGFNESNYDCENYGEKIDLNSIEEYETVSSFNDFRTNFAISSSIGENKKAKKLIILGAGASFDFSFDENLANEERPPLTYNLFNDNYDGILENYPGAGVLASQILNAPNVEVFFQEQWERIKNHYAPDLLNKIINTQYYFQDLFLQISKKYQNNKRSNYVSLIQNVSNYAVTTNNSIPIVSFNYDTLLESAMNKVFGYSFGSINDYVDSNRSSYLFKPHGSCNWIRRLANYHFPRTQVKNEYFSRLLYEKKVNYGELFTRLESEVIIDNNPSLANNESYQNRPFLPQLLIPYTDKDEFVMPQFHRETLENNLGNVEEILIIGWKGTEKVFKELLTKKLGNKIVSITVVNNKDATVKKELSDCFEAINWEEYTTFSEYMKKLSQTGDHFFK